MIKHYLVFVFIIFTTNSALEWHQKKYDHELQGVNEEELSYWAGLSNVNLFNDTLDRIAIPRVPGTRAHKAVQDYIRGEMESLRWNVKLDSFVDRTPVGNMKFSNIIATFNESAPRHLVLACHYDSKMDREKALVLATDSAVPCAMLIHLAKILDTHLRLPSSNSELSLMLIFFDGEEAFHKWTSEDSIYGSRHLARTLESEMYPTEQQTTNHLHRMDVMVLLDLLGSPNPTIYSYFDDTKDLFINLVDIENVLDKLGLLKNHAQNYFVNKLVYGGVEDDHIPFLERGVRILHLIPQPFPNVWHNEHDTVENLDFSTIGNLNKILTVFVVKYLHLPLGQNLL